jgi:hypothetical protein
MFPYAAWILFGTWLVCTGWILSALKQLNVGGYLVSLLLFLLFVWLVGIRLVPGSFQGRFWNPSRLIRRFRHPIPLIYLLYLLGELIAGAVYAPNNYDAFCYRIPRILHWLHEGQWHWTGSFNSRMDFSATGFEWLMLPQILFLKSLRFLFLINLLSYALLPGLIYSAFSGLGIAKRVAWYWMWILPCAYCFVLQAGGIGNDTFAAVYFLAAIAFSTRALRRSSWPDAAVAFLSAGLLTGSKALNLTLFLPLLLVLVPAFKLLLRKPWPLLGILIISLLISFVPIAVFNFLHTGDWTGDPSNFWGLKVKTPISGVVGNTLELSLDALEPPIFPMTERWNTFSSRLMAGVELHRIKSDFQNFSIQLEELPMEEGSGMGIGVTILLLGSFLICIMRGSLRLVSRSALILGLLCYVSLLAYMSKMGTGSSGRLIAAYYPGLILPFLSVRGQGILVRRRSWRIAAVICQMAALPALLISPARPLLPMCTLLQFMSGHLIMPSLADRVKKVYSVYSNRSDNMASIRAHLPPDAKVLGFAGTDDESEFSLWKKGADCQVVDLNPVAGDLPALDHVDCIVGSDAGFRQRYNLTADQVAKKFGVVIYSENITAYASQPPQKWTIIKRAFPSR